MSQLAFAYTPTLSKSGVPVRWKGDHARLPLVGNPSNHSGLAASGFFDSVVNGLQRWKTASGGQVAFDYWQGTDPKKYEANSEYNGLSSIYFVSNASHDPGLSPNVLGLTQVWYDTSDGEILEADIALNDLNYQFTLDPRDTSGYGLPGSSSSSSAPTGMSRRVFIENVITHEIGHAFGLSHSGAMQSTMLFMEAPEQAFLGCDDQVAIHVQYPTSDLKTRGAIEGSITTETGGPVFGAQVVVISVRRGTVLATAVTDKNGHYSVGALETGTYMLMVEPFFAGSSALPDFYAGLSNRICDGGQTFGRTILLAPDGYSPVELAVHSGQTVQAGRLIAHCNGERSGAANLVSRADSVSRSSAPTIFNGTSQGQSGVFGAADRFQFSNSVYYRIAAISGSLEVHSLSFSLYSPIRTELELLDSAGQPVTKSNDAVYVGVSGFKNYDSMLTAQGLAPGDYTIRVSSASLESSNYPAGPVSIDTSPFVVITGSVNEAPPTMASTLATNARCRMEENFGVYTSPPGDPERHSAKGAGGVGFCGTLEDVSQQGSRRLPPRGPGSPLGGDVRGSNARGSDTQRTRPAPSLGAIVGWFLPYFLMFAVTRMARRRERVARS